MGVALLVIEVVFESDGEETGDGSADNAHQHKHRHGIIRWRNKFEFVCVLNGGPYAAHHHTDEYVAEGSDVFFSCGAPSAPEDDAQHQSCSRAGLEGIGSAFANEKVTEHSEAYGSDESGDASADEHGEGRAFYPSADGEFRGGWLSGACGGGLGG